MTKTRMIMIGGFLGAGKTTAIARLARHYAAEGLRVAIVTNDQASGLVDTESLRAQGLPVGEVPGACFCCKFDDLVDTMVQLGADEQPDLILTEPVGSCTDLVATVVEPLRRLHGDRYEVGPLAVLCKPEHGRKILSSDSDAGGFSPKAAYIFLKQLEEADVVVVNKIDKLPPAEGDRLAELIRQRAPGKQVVLASGKRGDGFDELIDVLDKPRSDDFLPLEIDYDVYAEGEAELAWLNATVDLESTEAFDIDSLAVSLVDAIAEAGGSVGDEPAHIKVLGFADGSTCVANRVSSDQPTELSLASEVQATGLRMVINARVAGDPVRLESAVNAGLEQLAGESQLQLGQIDTQSFRPGRPEPTHRMA